MVAVNSSLKKPQSFNKIFSACTTDPPANTGVQFTPSTAPYPSGTIVAYSCVDSSNVLSPSPSTNECVNGIWIRASPVCFRKLLIQVMCLDAT